MVRHDVIEAKVGQWLRLQDEDLSPPRWFMHPTPKQIPRNWITTLHNCLAINEMAKSLIYDKLRTRN